MRCLIFCGGSAYQVVDKYNKWAKGKGLGKDVIIHSHVVPHLIDEPATITILVFFDEKLHEDWVGKDPWKKAVEEVMEERKAKGLTVPA